MNSYLQIKVSEMNVLLDASGVHEILELGRDEDQAYCSLEHRAWRGQVLARVSCRSLLGQKLDATAEKAGIVYSPDLGSGTPVMLEADGIVRLDHLDDADFTKLPPVPQRIEAVFDKVHVHDATGRQLFHLRRPSSMDFTHADGAVSE